MPITTPRTLSAPVAATVLVLALGSTGCAAAARSASQTPSPRAKATHARTPLDRSVTVAKQRWTLEQSGPEVHLLLRRVAADPVMRAAIRTGEPVAIRAAVAARYRTAWYHWHVSRLRVLRGADVIADAGVPFVIAPSALTLHDGRGAPLTLQVSDQDVIGYVRFMHRNHHVEVVTRGTGAAHVRSSLAAALHVHLPGHGTVTIAGRHYAVRAFTKHALNREPVRVWILRRA